MSIKRIASRYAKSLLELSNEEGQLEAVSQDMDWFYEALKSRDLVMLLKSPIVNKGKKREIFKAIFGPNLGKITNGFFNIILTKGRESLMPEIAEEYRMQLQKLNKTTTVKLKTASALSDEAIKSIETRLLESIITDEKLALETEVDPELIGGFVLEIGDKLYDDSIAFKLKNLKKEFSDNKYVKSY